VTLPAPVLEADGIGRAFGRKVVLKSAGLRAWPGRITALMGRNGIGKSTLLRIVIGKVRADYGRIVYRGEFQTRPSLFRLARAGLMYVSQESALTSLYTVRQHVEACVRTFRGDATGKGALDRLCLNDLLGRRPFELSGGERQRASLALALVRRPSCLLADEPFSGVAPRDRPMITAALEELRAAGAAVVITGHDVEDLFHVSDEIVWMVSGTTHVLGSPEEAANHPQFRQEYLGPRGLPGLM
jgi:ABC-type multidrug transport system ATPase subunit